MLGGGVLLALDPTEDKNKILGEEIVNDPLLKVSKQQTVTQEIIIYDVPVALRADELTVDIFNRNFQQSMTTDDFKKNFKPIFKLRPKEREHVYWACIGHDIKLVTETVLPIQKQQKTN